MRKDLGMRIQYDEETGYNLDKEVSNTDMLKGHGPDLGYSLRVSINKDWNESMSRFSYLYRYSKEMVW